MGVLLWFINQLIWLVFLTILKNISPLGLLFPIYGKIKNIPNHQSVIIGGANSYDGQFEAIWQLAATLMYLPILVDDK